MNPFVETITSKKELYADFLEFAKKRIELGQNAMLAHYGLFHGEAIMSFCDGKVDELMKYANVPLTSIAYFQAGFNAWKNLSQGLTSLPETNNSNNTSDNKNVTPLQQIFYGAPGTGKSYAIKELTKGKKVIRTTFHPDTDYSTFVGCYKPTTKEVPVISTFGGKAIKVKDDNGEEIKEERIVYEFVEQAFLQAYIKAWKQYARAEEGETPEEVYLIIEEINRGNCAQIFGDLFQLLDRNAQGSSEYPIKADADMKKQLKKQLAGLTIDNADGINALYEGKDVVSQVLEGDILLLPNNLYIWATMNTSDQSLFPIDSAFKRRWDWQYVPIANASKGWVIEANGKQYDWWDFLVKINALIGSTTHSEDKKLGYFFCKPVDGIITADMFVSKVIFYLWNDVFKDFEFDDDKFNDKEKDSNGNVIKLTFDKFYNTDVNGKPIVKEDKVDVFLTNLEVKFAIGANDDEGPDNDFEDSSATGFSLNGNPMSLRDIAMNVVLNYANNHPFSPAKEIRDYFINLCKGNGISHIVETEAEYHLRDEQPSQQRSVSEITIPNGEKLYVTTQWRANNENSNFIRFMSIVNNNGLGVISQ